MEPVQLTAGEFTLDQLTVADGPALLTVLDDREIRRWLAGYVLDDERAARAFVGFRAWQWANGRRYSWAVRDADGALAGEVGLRDVDHHDRTVLAFCWTAAAHRGRGVAASALGASLRFGFDVAGLHRVGYQHAVANRASRRVAEKCGFRLEGTLRGAELVDGRHHDLLQWSRLATD
ncbi:RimJ/RimL family protein N-acetyltransferase [Saccharothrix tamanrassetensis]|uniref:RimJ/RimL family protein N-acetyltransferase n=1 Tax=Saccharothrix tamanrassetensis TaxID=1051531 RepID=A0A841CG16_9PSEU|nr:GNAT family protein [Saccharothrix tamanrassetensis]MBB5955097.1 RimJ/RimL family protein N-acetyltransferase [Saccharothrix tamanrassetensis]